jgi:hypothetical protein
MKATREGTDLHIALSGPLGETSPFFTLPLHDPKSITIDMAEFTSINSIGVKNWILWTVKVPASCKVKLINAPLMIASQASMVMGFVNSKITIESLRLPFLCEKCNVESMHKVERGRDYDYAQDGLPAKIHLPQNLLCTKCKTGVLEPDLIVGKTFKFLG